MQSKTCNRKSKMKKPLVLTGTAGPRFFNLESFINFLENLYLLLPHLSVECACCYEMLSLSKVGNSLSIRMEQKFIQQG